MFLEGWCVMGVKLGTHFRTALKAFGIVFVCVISGLIGGAMTRNFGTSNTTISYADFVSIMLTAVSLLMTVLAIFLAVLGFVGWTTIEQKVHGKTEDFLGAEFKKGGRLERIVLDVINRKVVEIMYEGVEPLGPGTPREGDGDRPVPDGQE